MNIEIARKRYKDVFLPDVIDNSQGDFLSKHVPMKKLYLTDHAELVEQDLKQPFTEEEIYEKIFSESDEDQFVLVKGASGAGKSHLIRWMYTMLELRKPDSEIVIPIRRADNTLKGTIRQLINHPIVRNMPNSELYKKLDSASTTIPELELKNTIYYSFINLIESDDGKADQDEERMISNADRKHLVALLQNSSMKDRLMAFGGPIDRIYTKIAENKTLEINDKAAEFEQIDFEIDSEFRTVLYNDEADKKARKIADKLIDNPEFVSNITIYINRFIEKIVQRCTGLEPGDLREMVEDIRQEIYRQGCTLTILIEDITAASGVDDSLLDALLTNKRGYSDKKLCRVNSIVGVADGYYRDNFRTNTKGRIKQFIIVPDEMYNKDTPGLIEFVARYLNTVSLETEVINKWVEAKAVPSEYPIHKVTIGEGWGEFKLNDKSINLFPFTEHAISFLYAHLDSSQRNPRAIMRNLIEPYVKDSLDDLSHYPTRRLTLEGTDSRLQTAIFNRSDLDQDTRLRLTQFMYIWGNGRDEKFQKNGFTYISGLRQDLFEQLNLPIMDGEVIVEPTPQVETPQPVEIPSEQKENLQVTNALAEVDRWILDKNHKLNVGVTSQSIKLLNDAKRNINNYLFNVIDWTSEGVSVEAMTKIKDIGSNRLIAFERQDKNSNALVHLSASIDTRNILEAFIRWSEIGKESWDFPNSTDYLYRVQKWTEHIKPEVINGITHYGDQETEYFSYATAAEFYRLILNGNCQKYQSPLNFSPDLLLKNNETVIAENGHTKNWNDLLKITRIKDDNGKTDTDGGNNRMIVLRYFNIPQGDASSSTNYEYDYVGFTKAVRKVINNGLKYSDDQLQLEDPVVKRRNTSKYLQKIIAKIPAVVEEEKKAVSDKLSLIKQFVDLDEVMDEDDIKDITEQIKKFYSKAESCHISAAVHVDNSLINKCKKNASSIYSSIKTAQQVLNTEDSLESLIVLSNDPVGEMNDFLNLLSTTNKDLLNTVQEVKNRMNVNQNGSDPSGRKQYSDNKDKISECNEILQEVKNSDAN